MCTNIHGFLENYLKTAVAKEHILNRFSDGDWPSRFIDYAFSIFDPLVAQR